MSRIRREDASTGLRAIISGAGSPLRDGQTVVDTISLASWQALASMQEGTAEQLAKRSHP